MKKIKVIVGCFLTLPILLMVNSAFGKDSIPLWSLVNSSHLILEGKLKVPEDEINTLENRYVKCDLIIKNVFKGDFNKKEISFTYYTGDLLLGGPSRKHILSLQGKEVVVFLIYVDDGYVKGFYLARKTPRSIQAASGMWISRILGETSLQEKFFLDFETRERGSFPLEKEVKRAIEEMGAPEGSEETYFELIGFGKRAVPAIVKYMDDRRILTSPQITLKNSSPDSFEGNIHYGPQVVIDVLTIILSEITSHSFSSIQNGGSEYQRKEAIRAWKIYAQMMKGELF